ncbi:hypothetical protein [Pontibacter cellulosilyticus]|nr:hypothetical protein [Pontibacter cellulosilyticus]
MLAIIVALLFGILIVPEFLDIIDLGELAHKLKMLEGAVYLT